MQKTKLLLAAVAAAVLATISNAQTPNGNDLETINQSSRGYVGTGDRVLIGGAIVYREVKMVIRALGPTISPFVNGSLADPMVEVYDQSGNLLVSQRSYLENDANDLAMLEANDLIPGSRKEPAVVLIVQKGRYTAVVRGEHAAKGIALVEFYLVQ